MERSKGHIRPPPRGLMREPPAAERRVGAPARGRALSIVASHDGRSLRRSRPSDAVTSYIESLAPLLGRGRWAARLGLERGLDAMRRGDMPPRLVAQKVAGWLAELKGLRRDIQRAQAPAVLDEVPTNLEAALVAHIGAAENLGLAARVVGRVRRELLNHAALLIERGDEFYRRGERDLSRWRRALEDPE